MSLRREQPAVKGSAVDEGRKFEGEGSAPDNPFLIEQIIDDFDAVPHLCLRPF